MDISKHPIWNQTTPYKTKISALKKPFHLARIHIARQYAKIYPNELFIGITGSVGKTSCITACYHVLSEKYKTIVTRPNLDSILNIPLTILSIRPSVKKVLLEMGIEYKGEMDYYLSFVKPKIAVITRLNLQHSEYLGDLDEIVEEKGKLVKALPKDGYAILNGDDISSKKLALTTEAQVVYYGKDPKVSTIWAGNIRIEDFKTKFELNYGVERVQVEYNLLGEHQIYSALAAATLGVIEGLSLIQIKRGLEKVKPADHRLQVLPGPNGSIILDDTYNAAPVAVEAGIDTLLQIPARRRVVVLGEMRELGKYNEQMHRAVARKIYKEKIDLVFLGGGEAKIIAEELKSLGFFEDRLEFDLQNSQMVTKLLKVLQKGDVCLIKGARSLRLDEVVKRISKKG